MPATPTARIEALALAVATGTPVKEWAAAAGVPERTAYRWSETARFKARVVELRQQAIDQTLGRLTDAATQATDTLRALLADGTPATVRLGAARAILASLIEIQTHAELNERVRALEESVHASARPPYPGS
jgi:transposase